MFSTEMNILEILIKKDQQQAAEDKLQYISWRMFGEEDK